MDDQIMMTLARKLERDNFVNTLMVLRDIRRRERQELGYTRGATGRLSREDTTCDTFFNAHPDQQIAFARESGWFGEMV